MKPHPSCLAQKRAAAIRERNRRVVEHRHLVDPCAGYYAGLCQEPIEDLTQVGLLGLLRAAELYKSSKGIPFGAFARPHIRGAILHHLRDIAPMVRLPRRQAELQDRLSQLERRMEATPSTHGRVDEGRSPQLRQSLGVDEPTWRDLVSQRKLRQPLTIDRSWIEDLPSGSEAFSEVESQSSLEAMLNVLEPKQRRVVSRVVLDGASYRQLARELEVSPMTVQRLLHRGLARLREELQSGGVIQRRRHPPEVCRAASAARAC